MHFNNSGSNNEQIISMEKAAVLLLSVLATVLSCLIMMISVFLASNALTILSQRVQISTFPQSYWISYCATHISLFNAIGRCGAAFSILGPFLTITLLCKGEPLAILHKHLSNISRMTLKGTILGTVLLMLFASAYFLNTFLSPHSINRWGSLQNLVNNLLRDVVVIVLLAGSASLIVTVTLYTSIRLYARFSLPTLS